MGGELLSGSMALLNRTSKGADRFCITSACSPSTICRLSSGPTHNSAARGSDLQPDSNASKTIRTRNVFRDIVGPPSLDCLQCGGSVLQGLWLGDAGVVTKVYQSVMRALGWASYNSKANSVVWFLKYRFDLGLSQDISSSSRRGLACLIYSERSDKAKSRLKGGSCALQHLTPTGGGMLQHVYHNYYSCAPPPLL